MDNVSGRVSAFIRGKALEKKRETELLARIKHGDYHAFEEFISEYQNPLYAFLLRIVKDRNDALDLCQETFFKAYKTIRSFQQRAKFSTWLFQIGHYQSLNFIKKKKKRRDALKKKAQDMLPAGQAAPIEADETGKTLHKIISEIPRNQRTALHLFYKEEKTYGEIAAIMKTSLNNVKSYIFRGKEEVRKKMARDFGQEFQTN